MTLEIEGIDRRALRAWLDEQELGSGELRLTPYSGGTQNIVLRVKRKYFDAVLRRPPLHAADHHNASICREAKILGILRDTEVPHAELFALCEDVSVIGAAFLLMARVDGVTITTQPPEWVSNPQLVRAVSFEFIDALTALSKVNAVDVGIGSLDRITGWHQRQIDRWVNQLEGYGRYDQWSGISIDSLEELLGKLRRYEGVSFQAGMIHGDYHVANTLVHRKQPRVQAIIDWELATFGDPLMDLGELIATWPRANGRSAPTMVFDAPGVADVSEMVHRYMQNTAREIQDLDWYYSLACLRLGVLLEGTNARASAGLVPPEMGQEFHEKALALFEQGNHHWSW